MKIRITKRLMTHLGGLPIGAVVEVPDGDAWGEWAISTIYGELVEPEPEETLEIEETDREQEALDALEQIEG